MKKVFVGVRLKRLREERGLTQLALAEALGPNARAIAIGGYAVPLTAEELAGERPAKAPEPTPEASSGDAA